MAINKKNSYNSKPKSTTTDYASSVIGVILKDEKQERYETSHKTIGRDDSYPIQGRSVGTRPEDDSNPSLTL